MITTSAELEANLIELFPVLRAKYNVSRIGYFGSFARNQQTETSDIDLLVETSGQFDRWTFKDELGTLFGRNVDVVENIRVLPELRESILEDVRYVEGEHIIGAPFPLPGERRFMKEKRYDIYIRDIVKSLQKITAKTAGLDYETFIGDDDFLEMVQWNFIVAGEAAGKMPDPIRQQFPQIPWREMADFRNVVVHEYSGIDYHKMWTIIQNDIPKVLAELEKIAV